MLDSFELNPDSKPNLSIIWLHGLGAGQHDLVPLASMLTLPQRSIRHVFPQAPTRAVTLNNGYRMPAWFDLSASKSGLVEDEPDVVAACSELDLIVKGEEKRGMSPNAIVLAGFSQGGALALFCGMSRKKPLGALLVLSGWLPCAATSAFNSVLDAEKTPIFYAHGVYDAIVPPVLVQSSRARLSALGYEVESRDYPIEHTIDAQEMADLGTWLNIRLAR